MILLGLTGVPGAGKSLAAEYFRKKGAIIISGDDIGREVVENSAPVLRKLTKEFGKAILYPDGSLNRRYLGRIVFADTGKLKKLDAIVHPYLLKSMKCKISAYRKAGAKDLVVVDAALIFEWGIETWFDYILVITSSRTNRIKRLVSSGLTGNESRRRIASQIPQRVKASRADFVIENNGTRASLKHAAEALLNRIKS